MLCVQKNTNRFLKYTHIVDPGNVARHTGEDGGLLGVVAAHAGAKTHNTVNIPGAVTSLAVQRATRITLYKWGNIISVHFHSYWLLIMDYQNTKSVHQTHIAAGHHSVSTSAHHEVGYKVAPPVWPSAGIVVHNREQNLLQDISNGAIGWREKKIKGTTLRKNICLKISKQTWKGTYSRGVPSQWRDRSSCEAECCQN